MLYEVITGSLNSFFLPGNYVKVKIEGMELHDVAKIPRYVVDNEQYVYTMEEGKLARRKIELVTIQGNDAIIKNSGIEEMKIITTILHVITSYSIHYTKLYENSNISGWPPATSAWPFRSTTSPCW